MAGSTIPLPPTGLIKGCFRLLVIHLHWLFDDSTTKSASMNMYIALRCHRLYTHQTATVSRGSVLISFGTLLTPYVSTYGNDAWNSARPPQRRR
jgi:hypothetical protein